MVAARICLALCLLSLSSCIIPFLGALRPKEFISSEEMSPECQREVFDYIRLISGTVGDITEEEARTIQYVFTHGGGCEVSARSAGSKRMRTLKFYFSRSGDRLSIILYDGQVDTTTSSDDSGNSTHFTLGITNTGTGANVKTLRCRGPFVGQDVDLSKQPKTQPSTP